MINNYNLKILSFSCTKYIFLFLFLLSLNSCAPKSPQLKGHNAELSFAYLVLEEAMRTNDIKVINNSAKTFLMYDPQALPLQEIATYYLINENYSEARDLLEKMVKSSPEDLSIHLLLAETLVEMNEVEVAIRILEEYLVANPQNTNAQLELAIFYIDVEMYEKANEIFQNFTEEQINPISLYYYAKSLYAIKDIDLARSKLKEAVSLQPDFIEALFELALLEEELGNNQQAINYYNQILQYDPSNLDILSQLVYIYIINNDLNKAIKLAETISDSSTILLELMPILIDRGQYEQAEQVVELLDKDVEYYEENLLYRAAISYEKDNDIASALKFLYQVPETSEHYYRALRLIIELEISEEMYSEALFHVEKGFESKKHDVDLFLLKIQLFYAMGEEDKALEFAEEHAKVSFNKNIGSFFDAQTLYHYGGMLILNKRGEEAVPYLEKALKFVPDHYEALNSLAYYYAVEDIEIKKAYEIIKEVVKQNPEEAHFIDTLAWVQYRMGNYEDAYESINEAINLLHSDQVDPTILEHYGFIALELGYTEKAKDAFIKALEGEPENPEAIRKELEGL